MDEKRRRLDKLGTRDPAVTEMSDAALLAAYVTDPNATPAPTPKGSPLVQMLQGLTDDELIAVYEQAQAELAAEEAEQERRRPPPPEPESPVDTTGMIQAPVEPHPVALEEPTPVPPPMPTQPGAHTSYAVEGCNCDCCEEHVKAARREQEDRALAAKYAGEPVIEGSVRVAANATAALRRAVGAEN